MRNLTLLLLVFVSAQADVVLAPLFCDHLVLQRDKPLPVWGQAEPKETVTVSFRGQSLTTTADASGRWMVRLDAAPASSIPAELVVTGKNTVRVTDVLIGEVWLCSGQSNMELPVKRAQAASDEIAAANYPLIRQFKVKQTLAGQPAVAVDGKWSVCSPTTAGDFTAVGYFFARDIHARVGVPVGLINSTWGGTPIEAWMSAAAFASDPGTLVSHERWQKDHDEYPARKPVYDAALAAWKIAAAAAWAKGQAPAKPRPVAPELPWNSQRPEQLFNGMIHPLLPFALRGILWYQGETNQGHASEYRRLFTAMITDWRARFGQGEIPFFWVQLANYVEFRDETGTNWAYLREAQTQTLNLPATGQAVTIDLGTPGDVHPRNKQEVGRRLALLARARVYGLSAEDSSPLFDHITRERDALRVHFANAGAGLVRPGISAPGFEVAGVDRKYYPATAIVEKNTVLVSAPERVPEPVAVRYGWRNSPDVGLFGTNGLPVTPFRTDDW